MQAGDGRGVLTPKSGEWDFEGKEATARYCLYERAIPYVKHASRTGDARHTFSFVWVYRTPVEAPDGCTGIEDVTCAVGKELR